MKQFVLCSVLAAAGLLIVVGPGAKHSLAGPTSSANRSEFSVARDDQRQITRIVLPAPGGRVAWSDVLRGLARAGRLDDDALRKVLPHGSLDLTRRRSRFALVALNVALSPEIRMRIVEPQTEGGDLSLLVTLDRRALREKTRRIKSRIRETVKRRFDVTSDAAYGLRLNEAWEDLEGPLVIVIHGYNAAPGQVGGLVQAVHEAELPTGTFAYPNDQPIADSAERLSDDLHQLAADHPEREIAIVTHSMGGLVARAVIEDPELDPGNVRRLIMIASPNHGSLLAHLGACVDLWEHVIAPPYRKPVTRFYQAVEDGLGEATSDLKPSSVFLRELNARPRNEHVAYTIILGTDAPLTEQQRDAAHEAMQKAAARSEIVQLLRPRLEEAFSDLDEVVKGKGDGVVSVTSGRLDGVEDTLLMEFTHLGVIPSRSRPIDEKLREAIVSRLEE